MKKIIFLTLIFSLQSIAQNKNIRTALSDKNFSGTTIKIFPVQNELVTDCKNYAEFLIANAADLTAENVQFARTLPLRGQMKDSFEADFTLGTIANVEISNLQALTMRIKEGSLTKISTGLGLGLAPVEGYQHNNSFYLKFRSRDQMCDLLSNKIDLTANAQMTVSLNENEAAFLKLFYDDINAATTAILAENDNTFVKAALLGLAYTEIFRKHNLATTETKDNLVFLFNSVFKPGTLELLARGPVETSRDLGLTPVFLKAGLK